MVQEGFEFYENGKFDKALKQFKKVLKEDPDHPTALYGISKCLIAQGKHNDARDFINNLSNRFPEQDEIKELRETLNNKN